jgi:two-component system, sensor histidine kinase and response regulator
MDTLQTMLIIDDEENLLFGLKAIMTREGYQVFTASNGSEGLDMIHQTKPQIIICDVMMPPPSGFELRKILAQDPATADIPFIFLTARTSQDDKLSGLEMGADDYITKPFDVQELLARVRAVLRRTEQGRQLGLKEAEDKLAQLRQVISLNMSHEMRTPVSNMVNTLDLAMHERYQNRPDEMSRYIEMAMGNAQRLRWLVNDLLMLFDIDQNHINTFREQVDPQFDFRVPVEETIKWWQARGITAKIEVASDIRIHAPKIGFRQSVVHLVDNACKFSPPGGTVSISLMSNGDGGCKLVVSDEGPGIPEPLKEKVFERYFQVQHGDSREYGGLGVGLTIVRSFARALGGDVTILNSAKGCSIQMILPPAPCDWSPDTQNS